MSARQQVLVPSDNFDFVANFADGYRKLDFDVSAGRINFELECRRYDIVHLLWPEELTEWRQPTSQQIEEVLARLDRWAQSSKIIISVNNLYPHRYDRDPAFHRLYTGIYERADVIHHFSNASKELVTREFPSISGGITLSGWVSITSDCCSQTASIGVKLVAASDLPPMSWVFLAFGTLRFWREAELLQKAFRRARVSKKRLVLTAHYIEPGSNLKQRWRRWRWRQWQRSDDITLITERIPDAQLGDLFSAADAVIVVRQNSTSSGVPSMAMTFGRFVIAPDLGGVAEYVTGTGNMTYDQWSAEDLARAMERATTADREGVGRANALIAGSWGWKGIVKACLDALPSERHENRNHFG